MPESSESGTVEGRTSLRVVAWLWLIAALFVWPAAFQTIVNVVPLVLPVEPSTPSVSIADALAVTAASYLLCKAARSLGAPRTLWIAVAVSSVPAVAVLAVAAWFYIGDGGTAAATRAVIVVGVVGCALGPIVAAWLASRGRGTTHRTGT